MALKLTEQTLAQVGPSLSPWIWCQDHCIKTPAAPLSRPCQQSGPEFCGVEGNGQTLIISLSDSLSYCLSSGQSITDAFIYAFPEASPNPLDRENNSHFVDTEAASERLSDNCHASQSWQRKDWGPDCPGP